MAGLQDTEPGSETRRYGDTVGVPHGEADGTPVDNATVKPGDVVAIDSNGELALADASGAGEAIGVLVNYTVYGDSSNAGPYINGDVDATVAVQGTYKAKAADGALAAGDRAGTPDSGTSGESAGQFASGSEFRVVDVDDAGTTDYDWVEVVL